MAVSSSSVVSQKLATRSAEVSFVSNASLEVIKARSTRVQGLIDPSTNQFAFVIPVSSFEGFNSALQRQHFNENYMESERYPKAAFSGKLIERINFSRDTSYQVRAKGELEVHGVKQVRIIKGTLTIRGREVRIETVFTIPLSDHDISIPQIVSQKIATEIDVVFQCLMQPQQNSP
jgi:polyisoprenoid-binding protein YceI